MFKNSIITASITACVLALGVAGCDVKKVQEGNITVPKYDVQKTQSGDVTAPKYDVTTPDVNVGSEKRTVTVPTVDVTTAKEKEQRKQGS
jgi:predicted RecA/RadA family phage recombinase